MKFVFIINPISGKAQYQSVVDIVKLYAKNHPCFEYDLVLTEYTAHAKDIAANYPNATSCCFVACGGDGTLNEVLNGLQAGATLAQIPIGSGNDFFKMLGYKKNIDLESLVISTIEGKIVNIDYGRVNSERFINSCNMGLDADVLIEFNKNRGRIPNRFLYAYSIMKTIQKPKVHINRIENHTTNEIVENDMMLLTVMNGKYYGNGYTPTPFAEIQDGMFDICWAEKMSVPRIVSLLSKYKKGNHINEKRVHFLKSNHLTISSDEPLRYGLDGELKESYKIEIENIAGQLKFMVCKSSPLQGEKMKVYIEKDAQAVADTAYRFYEKLLSQKPNAVLGLATGSTPIKLYQNLIEGYQKSEISFKHVTSVNLDEYVGLPVGHKETYREFMNNQLFNFIDIDKSNTHVPVSHGDLQQNAKEYENLLDTLHIDLQLLGLGENGHIGFNEPGEDFDSLTHVVELDQNTRENNARFFDSIEDVPTQAITMGIASIMKANQILVLATGENKQEAVFQMVKGKVSSQFPCTALQNHPNVLVIVDEAAAKKLHE